MLLRKNPFLSLCVFLIKQTNELELIKLNGVIVELEVSL